MEQQMQKQTFSWMLHDRWWTDVQFYEPTPFSGQQYGHKFKAAVLMCEVAVSIENFNLVCVNGPYPRGKFSGVTFLSITWSEFYLTERR